MPSISSRTTRGDAPGSILPPRVLIPGLTLRRVAAPVTRDIRERACETRDKMPFETKASSQVTGGGNGGRGAVAAAAAAAAGDTHDRKHTVLLGEPKQKANG